MEMDNVMLTQASRNKQKEHRQTDSSWHEHNSDEAKLCIIGHETDFV